MIDTSSLYESGLQKSKHKYMGYLHIILSLKTVIFI